MLQALVSDRAIEAGRKGLKVISEQHRSRSGPPNFRHRDSGVKKKSSANKMLHETKSEVRVRCSTVELSPSALAALGNLPPINCSLLKVGAARRKLSSGAIEPISGAIPR